MSHEIYLPDVNVLFAAHRTTHEFHLPALTWLRAVNSFATCGTTEQGMVRLLTNSAVNPGASTTDALEALRRVRARRQHVFWPEQASLASPLIDVSRLIGHKQVPDFHLVNLAASFGGRLATFDTGIEAALAPSDRRWVKTLRP